MEKERTWEPPISIYLGNLADYAEGKATGEWIELPQREAGLQEKLDRISNNGRNELVIMAADFREDCGYLKEVVGEWDDVPGLNTVAALIGEKEHPAVRAYVELNEIPGIPELANLLMQEESIPYYPYDFEESDNPEVMENLDEYAKLGYTVIEQNPELMQIKDTLQVGCNTLNMYIDVEAVGRDLIMNDYMAVDREGYYDMRQEGPELNYYTIAEIQEALREQERDQEREKEWEQIKAKEPGRGLARTPEKFSLR